MNEESVEIVEVSQNVAVDRFVIVKLKGTMFALGTGEFSLLRFQHLWW